MSIVQVVAFVVLCVMVGGGGLFFLAMILFSDLGQPTALDEYESEQATSASSTRPEEATRG